MSGGIFLQVFAVVGEASEVLGLYVMQGKGKRHVAEAVMMAVGLTVCGDVDDLSPRALLGEASEEAMGEGFPVLQKPLKGHGTRDWAIVEEERNFPTRG